MPATATMATPAVVPTQLLIDPDVKQKIGENESLPIEIVGRKTRFFIPGDDIDREVIQSDICRYLDHDATVKPGHFQVSMSDCYSQGVADLETKGRVGYFIFAYRNLTTVSELALMV